MGLSRSLTVGTSSLTAHQKKFDVISNNLANANTTGFKANRANFEEMFSQTYRYGNSPDVQVNQATSQNITSNGLGGINPLQFGLGVKLGSISQDFSQGNIESTNKPLDMAIQGNGMFVYKQNGNEVYSRAGNVTRDDSGYLVDTSTGAFLQGYNALTNAGKSVKGSNGVNLLTSGVEDLRITDQVLSEPQQTENMTISGNLNSGNSVGSTKDISMTIYDNIGGTHDLKLSFEKTGANTYQITGQLNGNALGAPFPLTPVTFNTDGTLSTPQNIQIPFASLNTTIGASASNFISDLNIKLADPNNLSGGLTEYAASNTLSFIDQDGYTQGNLIDLSVDDKGQIWGSFTNGESERLGQVVLAKFQNQEGLMRVGNNFYDMSPNSGSPIIGTAVDQFKSSSVKGNSLEQSNVDMTTQFTDMISTQRAFEAAARTVTVSDQLLAEANQLKR